jgi:hypothetical protein
LDESIAQTLQLLAHMPSNALRQWQTAQASELDRMAEAHKTIGGSAPGRRWRLQHLNDAYIVLLAAHFQSFCRNLHSEAASAVAAATQPPGVQIAVLSAMQADRRLDRGNATVENIRGDFAKFGMTFWIAVESYDTRNRTRRLRLDQLLTWRNAIAHQDFRFSAETQKKLAGTDRTLTSIKRWRSTCNELAANFDAAVHDYVRGLTGIAPWV